MRTDKPVTVCTLVLVLSMIGSTSVLAQATHFPNSSGPAPGNRGDTLGALAKMQEESAKAALAPPQAILQPPAEMLSMPAPTSLPVVIAIYGLQNNLVADVLVENRLQTVHQGQAVLSGHVVKAINADGVRFALDKTSLLVPVTRLLGGP